MDIKLSDYQGNTYRLIPKNKSSSVNKSGAPKIHTLRDAESFLNSLDASAPNFWRNLWKQLGAGLKVSGDRQIIKAIAQLIKDGRWLISLDKRGSASATKRSASKATRGRYSGGGGGSSGRINVDNSGISSGNQPAALGSGSVDHSFTDTPYSSSNSVPGEGNAIAAANPAKVSETSHTAVVINEDETTKGCPISMVSGEEVLPLTDFALPGPVPFVWKRFYRTGHNRDIGLGHGWTHAACEYLTLEKNQAVLFDNEGRQLRFARPALYQRSKLINEGLNLDFEGQDCFVLKQTDQPDKVFSRLGDGSHFRLTQIRHADYRSQRQYSWGDKDFERGFCINLHYNASNQLTRLQGNWGKSLTLSRNAQGRIACVELVSESPALKQATAKKTTAKKIVAEYDYSEEGDLIAQRNAADKGEHYQYTNHVITQRTLVTGFSYYYEWDQLNTHARCLRNWGDKGIYNYHFKWEPENNTSYATDSRGYTTAYIYNAFGEIIEERDPEGGVHRYTYDRGRKIEHTDPEGNITRYQYDKENRFNVLRDALNNYQSVHYFHDRPTEFREKDNTLWQSDYPDWEGNTLWQREYALRSGRLMSMTDPYGKVTHYTYHDTGLLKESIDPEGRSTQYHWNNHSELIQITDFEGNKQQLKYNAFGQIVERHVFIKDQKEPSITPSITEYRYSVTGQLVKLIAPNNDTTRYQFNDNEQLIQHSDPQGRITRFEYDGLSQVTRRIDANGYSLTYQYDKERNLTGLINENSEVYRFEYDGCERLIKETGFDGRVQKYTYNKAGHLIQHQDGSRVITDYERDAIGQMVTKTCRHINNEQPEERSRYQYDPKGRLVETYNPHQCLVFGFDQLGNLKKERHWDIKNKTEKISASMVDIEYGIQWPNKRSQISLPDGQSIDYIYSADQNKALEKIQFNGKSITEIHRDSIGRETQRSQGNTTTLTEYDPMGRLQKQQAFNLARKQQIIQREYAYDNFGNLNQLTDGNSETRYVYDLLNRLEKAEGTETEVFDFDPAGNIVGINETKIKGEKKQAIGNRLAMQGDKKFTYDERGNLIKEVRGKAGKLVVEYHTAIIQFTKLNIIRFSTICPVLPLSHHNKKGFNHFKI